MPCNENHQELSEAEWEEVLKKTSESFLGFCKTLREEYFHPGIHPELTVFAQMAHEM